MLKLDRKHGEGIVIGATIRVVNIYSNENKTRLGIIAPGYTVLRDEVAPDPARIEAHDPGDDVLARLEQTAAMAAAYQGTLAEGSPQWDWWAGHLAGIKKAIEIVALGVPAHACE